MTWYYNKQPIEQLPKNCVGFVYQITNIANNRKYIGKKLAQFKRSRPPLKGKKNKRRYKVDSDWRDYYGSNEELLAEIKMQGTENFYREIEIERLFKEQFSRSFQIAIVFAYLKY